MVRHGEGRPTVDAAEREALLLIADADAVGRDVEVGARTELYQRRPWPRTTDDDDRDTWPWIASVDLAVARRLRAAGYLTITPGALITLTDAGRAVLEAPAEDTGPDLKR